MGYGAIVKWDAPVRAGLGSVDDVGAVVFVRIAPQSGALNLGADASGILPHVVYIPTLEPLGTSTFQEVDMQTMALGQMMGDVRVFRKTSFADKAAVYWIDLNCPFVAPWKGEIFIEGGAVSGGSVSYQDVDVVISRPELAGDLRNGINVVSNQMMTRHRLEVVGQRPMTPPTITFAGVGATPVPTPRGAKKVIASDNGTISFVAGGTTFNVPVRAGAGQAQPLGYVAGGTFAVSAGSIALISFELDIA